MFIEVSILLVSLLMLLFIKQPITFCNIYVISRPLFQSYAVEHATTIYGIPLTGIPAIILIIYSTLFSIFKKDSSFFLSNTIPLYILIILSSLSFLNTLNNTISISAVFKLLTAVSMYNLVYNSVNNKSDLKKVLFAIAFSSIIPMIVGFYQFFAMAGGKGIEGYFNRVKGTLGFANAYGIFIIVCICSTLILILLTKRSYLKKLLLILFGLMLISTIISLNRGTWIAFTISIIVSVIFYRKTIVIKWLFISILIFGILFSGIIIKRFQQLDESISSYGGSNNSWETTNTFTRRVEMWKAIIRLVPNHPIIGFGIGTADLVTFKYYKLNDVPHNDYVRLLLEIGFIGTIFYIIFLFRELILNLHLCFRQINWKLNLPIMICIIYWIIISGAQNIIYHIVNFPLFLALLAISKKGNQIYSKNLTFNTRQNL
jgi:O-antigen ligase